MFKEILQIESRLIGKDHPVFIIAEAGIAHFGSIESAYELVDLACKSKADAFKIQLFDVDMLIASSEYDWKDRLRPRNLTFNEVEKLKNYCESRDMIFMATVHDESRIQWIDDLNISSIKVGSGEVGNIAFIKKLAKLHKPLIISTGMHDIEDVKKLIKICEEIECCQLSLLHCISSYPTPYDQVNLRVINHLSSVFNGPIGYSDHTEDHLATLVAVSLGAKIIERHITIKRNIPNAQDWKVSSGPENFPLLVSDIRNIEKILGKTNKTIQPCEKEAMKWAIKTLVARRDLKEGENIGENDLISKRCASGIPLYKYDEVIGKKLLRDIFEDEAILDKDIE